MICFCVFSLGGGAKQIAEGVDIGGTGIADNDVAQACLGPGLDAEAFIAGFGDGGPERSNSRLLLHDEDR